MGRKEIIGREVGWDGEIKWGGNVGWESERKIRRKGNEKAGGGYEMGRN